MPGIVGLLTRMPRQRAVPELLRMVEVLMEIGKVLLHRLFLDPR